MALRSQSREGPSPAKVTLADLGSDWQDRGPSRYVHSICGDISAYRVYVWTVLQPPRSVLQARRVLCDWTQRRLATAIGVTQSAISQFERGEGINNPDLAAAIAAELDTPAALLGVQPPVPRILHLLPPSLPQKPANRALASVTLAHARVALLLGTQTVVLRRSPGGASWGHPHGYAESVRKDWQLPPGPISGLVPTLENNGIVCVYRDLGDLRTHALASTSADGAVLMLLDSGASRRELGWAITHELGHLVFGDEPSKAGESDANEFAIEFLAPGRELLDVSISTSEDLAAAATKYGVPPRLLLRRLRQIRRVSARGERELASAVGGIALAELGRDFLGSPSRLADTVRTMGGSPAAAQHASVSSEELRRDYLAGSGQ